MSAVTLLSPLAGLPGTEYELEPVDAGLFTLRSQGGTQRLFVVAGEVLPSYQPEVADEQAAALGLAGPDDAELYVVVNPADGEPTLNLMAPIVVNRRTRAAAQLVLDGTRWPLRAALGEVLAG
ncbi:MAG TPA: flagellar assembly protein FliW [Gryllotalpicola sp.]